MKKLIAMLLIIALVAMAAGCAAADTEPTGNGEIPTVTETPEPSQPEQTGSLASLRAKMQGELIAVADFGYPELSEVGGIMDYLQEKYSWWLAENDFIGEISQEQIVLTCEYGTPANLVCIVPADGEVTICVKVSDESESVVYQSENGEPILLLAIDDYEKTVYAEITGADGQATTWYPYKGGTEPFPGDARSDGLVFDFTPVYEADAYDAALAQGWVVPEAEAFRTYQYWRSDYRYLLELSYDPGQVYDGIVWLYDYSGMSELVGEDFYVSGQGYWYYINGVLHLDLEDYMSNKTEVALSVLVDGKDGDNMAIFCTEGGQGLPQFFENMQYDVLTTRASDAISFYDYALSEGWRLPEFYEMSEICWESYLGYCLELKEDGVPGDNNGEVTIYDVGESGEYTTAYTGSWSYTDGMLHLLLVPTNNGQFIDDSFPVLMLDGQLMICLNEYGSGLPHFTMDTMSDVLFPTYG